jgi:hypothetical protein
MADHVGLVVLGVTGFQSPARAGRGRRSGARNGGRKGAAGPDTHPEVACGLGLAGGWPATTNLTAEELGFRRGIRDAGGDSRHFGPIPSRGRLKAARRTYSARRAAGGSTESAALGGSHGAACRLLGGSTGRRRALGERRKEEGASRGAVGVL